MCSGPQFLQVNARDVMRVIARFNGMIASHALGRGAIIKVEGKAIHGSPVIFKLLNS
jgi:hypothetical protein